MKTIKTKKIISVLVGEKLSGKEMVSKYLVKRYRFKSFRFSKIVVDILNRLHLPITRVNEMNLMGGLRERFGGGILAEVLKFRLEGTTGNKFVIDGLRHLGEYEILSKIPGFLLVYVTASLATRFKRAKARSEKVGEAHFNIEQFKREENLPTEVYIKRLGKKASIKLINENTLGELYKQIENKIISRYIK
ncbi:MAG: hypothetical protein WC575_01090 [Patescibacteria group bacterium]